MPAFACPHCGFEVANVPATLSGKRVRCKQCAAVFELPTFDSFAEPVAAEPVPAEPVAAEVVTAGSPFDFYASPQSSSYGRSATAGGGKRRSKSNNAAVAAFVLGILCILLFWVPIVGMLLCLITLVTSVIGILAAKRGNGGMAFSVIGGVLASLGIGVYIALLVFVFNSYGTLIKAVEEGQVQQAREDLAELQAALDGYLLANGGYPERLEQLFDDVDSPGGDLESVLEDPWINRYEYKRLSHQKGGYRLWSRGPDEKSGTADDIHAQKVKDD